MLQSNTVITNPGAVGFNPSTTFLIEEEGDFPVQDGTTITLNAGVYFINATIVTAKQFNIPNGEDVTITAYDSNSGILVYTGVSNMINNNGSGNLTCYNITFSCPSGTLFDLTPATAQTNTIYLDTCVIFDCSALGSVSNIGTFATIGSAFVDCGTGLNISNTNLTAYLFTQWFGWKNNNTSYFITGTGVGTFVISACLFTPESNETVLDSTAGDVAQGVCSGISVDETQGGTFFESGSIDHTNINWQFEANRNISRSRALAEVDLKSNSTQTSLSAADTPAIVAGTWVQSQAERFTTTSSGRATYVGLDDINVTIISNPETVLALGTNKDITFYLSKGNDTTNTITGVTDQGGGTVRITTGNAHGLSTNDEVFITNTTSYNGFYVITVIDSTNFDITATYVASETGNWQEILQNTSAGNQIESATKASSTSVISNQPMMTNDFIELFVENNTDATNLVIRNVNLLISN